MQARTLRVCLLVLLMGLCQTSVAAADKLLAGAAKVDITDYTAGPVADTLYAKALVLKSGETTVALITLDAVAIGEIGYVRNDYLAKVRARLEEELGIRPANVMANASHCHGIVAKDVDERTVEAVKQAAANLVPVHVGLGMGEETRVSENRRMKLKDGRTIDVRHAYSLPPDEEVAEIGPIDPQIGVLRLDRESGGTLAVVYNFACHPIQGVPGGGNTADLVGYASQVIEENLSGGTIALFVQGCGGDINPTMYKDVDHPRDAETLGSLLGLSTLRAVRAIRPAADHRLSLVNRTIELPRANLAERIRDLEGEQTRLVGSFRGTSLNLKTFLELTVKYNLAREFPSYYAHRYLFEQQLGRERLAWLDQENRRNVAAYMNNIYTMEQLTRVQINLALLKKHEQQNLDAPKRAVDVEVVGLRVGDFTLVTFPGELTVRIGLNLKQASPHKNTLVAGYTNGYIYYAPTDEQLENVGNAQEDSDCILAPGWQKLFETAALEVLGEL